MPDRVFNPTFDVSLHPVGITAPFLPLLLGATMLAALLSVVARQGSRQ